MPELSAENRRIRALNVTASEVGALMGDHPYVTPGKIWDRLNGAPGPEQNEAMANGSAMEPAIARLASHRLGVRLRACTKTYEHKTVPLCATPDYYVLGTPPGLVEIKLSGSREMWSRDDPPDHVLWQVRAQMACANRDTVAICVLVGSGLRTYIIERDRFAEEAMLEAVDTFWTNHVITGIRPDDTPRPIRY